MPISGWTLACVVWAVSAAGVPHTHSPGSALHLANSDTETKKIPTFALSAMKQGETLALDLGEVIRETEVPIQFTIVNDTDEALALTSVRSSCACTEIDAWPVELKPGEAGEVAGSFHAPKRSRVRRTSEVTLRCAGDVVGAVKIAAEIVDPVRSSVALRDGVFVVQLHARDGAEFAVTGVEPSLAHTLTSERARSKGHTLEFTHKDWAAAGSPKRLAALIDHPKQGHAVLDCAEARSSTSESAATPRRAAARDR